MQKRLRHYSSAVLGSELVRSNTVMLAGTGLVSALNYLYYPVLSRMLSATQLGEVQVVLSITTQVLFVMTIGRMVILNVLTNEQSLPAQRQFMKEAEKALARAALGVSLVVLAFSGVLQHFLRLGSMTPVLLLIPLIVVSAGRNGRDAFLRAHLLFKEAVVGDVLVSVLRIVVAVVLVKFAFGTSGAVAGLVAGMLASLWYAQYVCSKNGLHISFLKEFLPGNLRKPIDTHLMKPHLSYAVVVAFVGILQALMVVMDAVTAKHYFPPAQAGLYAGISIVGNIVLFITGSVGGVLVASVRTTIDHRYNVRKLLVSFGLLLLVGCSVTLCFALLPRLVVGILLGQKYTVYAHLLPRVATTMLLLSVANLVFTYHIALRDLKIAYTAIAGISIMTVSVLLGHHSLSQMVNSILLASSLVAALTVARTIWWNAGKLRAARTAAAR